MVSDWPVYKKEWSFDKEETEVELMKNAVRNIRNLRSEMNVAPSRKAAVYVVSDEQSVRDTFEKGKVFFATLAYASEVFIQKDKEGIDEDAVSTIVPKADIYMPFADLVDIDKELARLDKERGRLQGEIKRCEGMLSNEKFVSKAPTAKIEEEKGKLAKYTDMLKQVEERLSSLKK